MTANRWFCSRARQLAPTELGRVALLMSAIALCVVDARLASASPQAPEWMHALAGKPLPAYDEKTDAVLLYSETNVTVFSKDKVRTHVREVYKILRPGGREHGWFAVYTYGRKRVTFMRGWCIPAHGKDYEVTDRDAVEQSPMADGYNLISDLRRKILRIPAPDPGNIVGYEYEIEEQPFFLQDQWEFQEFDPVRASRYTLELPDGWEYKSSWINQSAISPVKTGPHTWQWDVADVAGIRHENQMPPVHGIAGKMVVSYSPPGGTPEHNDFATWNDMGKWYDGLVGERISSSGAIKEKVSLLTLSKVDTVAKMRSVAEFIQTEIRYVGIELGIGGWQPHTASDVFTNRYGDCKDKATLVIAMMRSMGIDAYHVIINASRDAVGGDDPAHNGFNHAITAIRLPDNVNDPSLVATIVHPKLGRLLFFDPTDEVTPFGRIRGALQSNYGLLVGPDGGELLQLPRQDPALTGINRIGKLELDPSGTLYGEVQETRIGDRAVQERQRLRDARTDSDKLKLLEGLLSDSLGTFQLTASRFVNVADRSQPLGIDYAFQAPGYGKNAGDLLLVRPRVLGSESSGLLETNEPRRFAIEFDSPSRDSDVFEISLPPGFEVADVASPVDVDFGFANYHSKTELSGNILRYVRTFEVKDVSVPASKAAELKKLYRIVAADERNTVILKERMQAQESSPASAAQK